MAKQTLLDLVQNILSSMTSDSVNTIGETTESMQVVQIIEDTYFDIISTRDWPHLHKMSQLTALADLTKPTHMKLPDNIQSVDWIKYNIADIADTKVKYQDMTYMDAASFVTMLNGRDSSDSTITSVTDYDGIELLIKNDSQPQYWTSFDDEYIVFDGYDSGTEATLQNSKTQISVYMEPTFTRSDTYIPDLPSKLFSYLKSESKSVAFNEIRQAPNSKEEQKSRRLRTWTAQEKHRINGKRKYPDYGRK